MKDFQKNNLNLVVFNAVLHMDEATPHLHIDFVPFSTRQKQGLSKKVSLKGALAEQGIFGKDKKHTEWQVWCNAQKKILGDIVISHGFEVEHKDVSKAHLNCDDYRKQRQLVDKTKKEVVSYQKELETAKNQVEVLKSKIIELNDQKDYYNKLLQDKNNLLEQKNKLGLDVATLFNDINRLNSEQSTLISEISRLTKHKNSSSTEVELLNNKFNSLKSQITELDELSKEFNSFKEDTQKQHFRDITNVKIQSNNEHNQLNLLRKVLNIPKDIDTYDNLNGYLYRGGKNRTR